MEMKGSKCTCLPQYNYGALKSQSGLSQAQSQAVLNKSANNALLGDNCGTYCKRLGPRQQRRIIADLIAKEQLKQQQSQQWEPKRYLINQKWWSQWCDYVNFDTKIALDNSCDINLLPKQSEPNSPSSKQDQHNSAKRLISHDWNELDTSKEAKHFADDESEDSNDVSQQLYEKPPRIVNIHLLDPFIAKGQKQRLKSNLIEHFDFESLHP